MSSSTSSSSPKDPRASSPTAGRTQRRALLLSAAVFACSVTLVAATWRATPLRVFEALVAREQRPDSPDYYLAYSAGLIEHHVFYHGLEPIARPLCAADVLFLGDSRTMQAFPRSFVQQLWSRYHLRGYVLGFGGGEMDVFPLAIIERYALRPRWVIVNPSHFFTGRSPAASGAMRFGRFSALQVRCEGIASHVVRRAIHRVLPHIASIEHPTQPDWIVYRSVSDGTWFMAAAKGEPTPLHWGPEHPQPVPASILEAADHLAGVVRGRGAKLLLVYLAPPAIYDDRACARAVAQRVHAPFILPRLEGLFTSDGMHLAPASAKRFDAELLDSLGPYLAPGGRASPARR